MLPTPRSCISSSHGIQLGTVLLCSRFELFSQALLTVSIAFFCIGGKVLVCLLHSARQTNSEPQQLSASTHLLTAAVLSKSSIHSSQLPFPVKGSGIISGFIAISQYFTKDSSVGLRAILSTTPV